MSMTCWKRARSPGLPPRLEEKVIQRPSAEIDGKPSKAGS